MHIRIGTRGSALALRQTQLIGDLLIEQDPHITLEVTVIKTRGDVMQNVSLADLGGKGVFLKEIEDALLRGDIDLAIHSLKDCPAEIPRGLEIVATPKREDPRDVLIARESWTIACLPRGALLGTGSLRRQCQLLHLYPDLQFVPIRGNLDTRIRKIEATGLHGIIVAAAGLSRMGWLEQVSYFIPPELAIPAVGQGTIALEVRQSDGELRSLLTTINDPITWQETRAERAFLHQVGGGCRLPLGAYAKS